MKSYKNICILGDGLLGKELHKQTGWDMISRNEHGFDITKPNTWDAHLWEREHGTVMWRKYDVIINCMAYTNTYGEGEDERVKHWDVNYKGVVDLSDYCAEHGFKLVHISTDYVYTHSEPNADEFMVPVHCATWYGYTKLLGDAYVQLKVPEYLVIRSTHKPEPFPYTVAWSDQFGNFDYVSVIANLIIQLILKNARGVVNVGTEKKTMYDLAVRTKPSVLDSRNYQKDRGYFTPKHRPDDVTMNMMTMNFYLTINDQE